MKNKSIQNEPIPKKTIQKKPVQYKPIHFAFTCVVAVGMFSCGSVNAQIAMWSPAKPATPQAVEQTISNQALPQQQGQLQGQQPLEQSQPPLRSIQQSSGILNNGQADENPFLQPSAIPLTNSIPSTNSISSTATQYVLPGEIPVNDSRQTNETQFRTRVNPLGTAPLSAHAKSQFPNQNYADSVPQLPQPGLQAAPAPKFTPSQPISPYSQFSSDSQLSSDQLGNSTPQIAPGPQGALVVPPEYVTPEYGSQTVPRNFDPSLGSSIFPSTEYPLDRGPRDVIGFIPVEPVCPLERERLMRAYEARAYEARAFAARALEAQAYRAYREPYAGPRYVPYGGRGLEDCESDLGANLDEYLDHKYSRSYRPYGGWYDSRPFRYGD
ncbi:MAG: hypothetical protein AB8B55_02935 [Mariniblastus sp.]